MEALDGEGMKITVRHMIDSELLTKPVTRMSVKDIDEGVRYYMAKQMAEKILENVNIYKIPREMGIEYCCDIEFQNTR